jgi:hypothetical protein
MWGSLQDIFCLPIDRCVESMRDWAVMKMGFYLGEIDAGVGLIGGV